MTPFLPIPLHVAILCILTGRQSGNNIAATLPRNECGEQNFGEGMNEVKTGFYYGGYAGDDFGCFYHGIDRAEGAGVVGFGASKSVAARAHAAGPGHTARR